jgi:hypothetical protein
MARAGHGAKARKRKGPSFLPPARPSSWAAENNDKRPEQKLNAPAQLPRKRPSLDATKIVASLPRQTPEKLVQTWLNAIDIRDNGDNAVQRGSAQKVLKAINAEWQRRGRYRDQYFRWPTTRADKGQGGFDIGNAPDKGLLRFMGYRVGRTDGVRSETRRSILSEVFSGTLPPFESPEYLDQWGDPETANRLKKLAECIAAFARNAKRRKDHAMDDAVRDWEADLKFLYDRFYVGHFRFAWPTLQA